MAAATKSAGGCLGICVSVTAFSYGTCGKQGGTPHWRVVEGRERRDRSACGETDQAEAFGTTPKFRRIRTDVPWFGQREMRHAAISALRHNVNGLHVSVSVDR